MRWLVGGIIIIMIFIAGAFYGIDKTNEKLEDRAPVVTTQTIKEVDREANSPVQPSANDHACVPPISHSEAPWISKMAGGIGEGIASCFNAMIVVLAEIIQSGS